MKKGSQQIVIAHFTADKFAALAFVANEQIALFPLKILAAQADHFIAAQAGEQVKQQQSRLQTTDPESAASLMTASKAFISSSVQAITDSDW